MEEKTVCQVLMDNIEDIQGYMNMKINKILLSPSIYEKLNREVASQYASGRVRTNELKKVSHFSGFPVDMDVTVKDYKFETGGKFRDAEGS
ncbi:hypothetical protein [Bacillus phage YungSlug]|nr:hypothetical protein [Bacillus phage YungSlug]